LTSPSAGDHSLSVTYAAQGNFAGSSANGTLHVNPAPPVLTVPGPITVNEGQSFTFTVSASDLGTPSASLVFSASSLPLGATFDGTTQTFAWTPNSAQGGANPYLISFTATNGQSTDTKTVRVTVNDTLPDADGDGVPDAIDNCPNDYNPDQVDICHNSP